MKVTLVFNSSVAARFAYDEYFSEAGCDSVATLDLKNATIAIERIGGETHIDIMDGLIAIII